MQATYADRHKQRDPIVASYDIPDKQLHYPKPVAVKNRLLVELIDEAVVYRRRVKITVVPFYDNNTIYCWYR